MSQNTTGAALTFREGSYWWLWIPIISWLPFSIPVVLPLGPIMIGFTFAHKMRFIREAAAHNGETLPDGVGAFIGAVYTLGYNSVHRTYKAAKKMLSEQMGRPPDRIPGWSPWLLPFYILCPALIYMPLIRIMRQHWEWHLQQSGMSAPLSFLL